MPDTLGMRTSRKHTLGEWVSNSATASRPLRDCTTMRNSGQARDSSGQLLAQHRFVVGDQSQGWHTYAATSLAGNSSSGCTP
jgi:hypothetical protein